jgi:protein-S-isoprenylcysteine O-methyltransferase Ste14
VTDLVQTAALAEFVVLMAGWFGFGLVFLLRKRPPKTTESKRDRTATIGIVFQSVAYAVVWGWPRLPTPSGFAWLPPAANLALDVVVTLLVVGTVWLVLAAVRTLGKQWAVAARLVDEHELITSGPYRLVRNPIYTGMLGLLLASALTVSRWPAILLALAFFAVGTGIRVRSEQRLLKDAFGEAYERYAREVPAVLPFLRSRRST